MTIAKKLRRTRRHAARFLKRAHRKLPHFGSPSTKGNTQVNPHGARKSGLSAARVAELILDDPRSGGSTLSKHIAAYSGGLRAVAPDGRIHDRAQLRKLLGGTERQLHASPVTVRFDAADCVAVPTDRFTIMVDSADAAVSPRIVTNGHWEPHITAVFEEHLKIGMTAIDVGANVGWHSLTAASLVGPQGRVIAVEPWSENCRLLLLSMRANGFDQIDLWPWALDSRRGWINFMTFVGSNAGIIPDSIEAISSGAGTIVPTFTLDEMLPAECAVHLIKIDVEGAEYRVLLGAQRTIEAWRPVVISEFAPALNARASGETGHAFLSWFTSRGWRLHVILRNGAGLQEFSSAEDLLSWWPHDLHLEDLLFLPS